MPYEMIMPMVVCESEGGTYDDAAYTAGFEAGVIYGLLSKRPMIVSSTCRGGNVKQMDLIAMRHGYTMEIHKDEDDWVSFTMRRIDVV